MEVLERLRTTLADRYEIEREIGAGGMATVYLARDLRHSRRVGELLIQVAGALLGRVTQHDLSKLERPEREAFDRHTAALRGLVYGSPEYYAQLAALGLGNALIITGAEVDKNFGLAARNIPNLDVLPVQGINVYDILRRHTLVLTKAAVDALEARFR